MSDLAKATSVSSLARADQLSGSQTAPHTATIPLF
jgi:hypothetical protein